MFNPQILRHISMVVLVTFTSLTMQPLQAAIQLQDKIEQGKANSLLKAKRVSFTFEAQLPKGRHFNLAPFFPPIRRDMT